MNYADIKYCDIANGVGVRTTLFVSGCTHHCPGCFQPETWDFAFGQAFTPEVADALIESLRPAYITGLTLLGGEPMEPANQHCLVELLERVRQEVPGKSVWCFTGDHLEDLLAEGSPRRTEVTRRLLELIDVLVDGPFVLAEKDIALRFRGSRNQRLIDLPATLAQGHIVLWEDEPIFASHSW